MKRKILLLVKNLKKIPLSLFKYSDVVCFLKFNLLNSFIQNKKPLIEYDFLVNYTKKMIYIDFVDSIFCQFLCTKAYLYIIIVFNIFSFTITDKN